MPPKQDNKVETRAFSASYAVEKTDTEITVSGMGAVFNSWSQPMSARGADIGQPGTIIFREKIRPGAFAKALAQSDARALRDHTPTMILGRMSAGTLDVWETDTGLSYRYKSPNTSYANDLLVSMERGDVRESSFSFVVADMGEIWERRADGTWEREIVEFDELYDVSPVTYPAYPDTSVAIRSLQIAISDEKDQEKSAPLPGGGGAGGGADTGDGNTPDPDPLTTRRLRLLDIIEKNN